MADNIIMVSVDKLRLDPENPRLPESLERSQQAMIDYIAETTSIEELMEAIAENGFFPSEPLIAVPTSIGADSYHIVEGNRRLTAVKLLRDPSACSKPGERMRNIVNEARHVPKEVPIVIRDTRAEILPYLGFRHITGVKQWEPLAKARYIEQLFILSNKELSIKDRYTEVARAIGSRRDHIRRSLDALAVYKVIKDKAFFEIDDLNEETIKFSILSTALADERIAAFAGTNQKTDDGDYISSDPIIDPTKLNSTSIEELTSWLYEKDKNGKTRIGESRNLRFLAGIVSNDKALSAFRNGALLKIAYQMTADVSVDFAELLYQADACLTEASSMVATIEFQDDVYETAKRISENIKMIGRQLKEKRGDDF
jgi:hypothetical protein